MILGVKPVTLWAERIKRCTVQGARTSKGPINQLTSSLRSRRKLRLVGPGNGQKPVCVRSPWRPAGRNGQVGRLHFPKTGRSREADMRLAPRHPRTVFTRKSLLQARNPPFLHTTAGLCSIAEGGSFRHPIRLASSRSSPISGAFQAGQCLLHRNDKDTAFLRTKFVSRRGFDFVLRSLPSPRAELRGK